MNKKDIEKLAEASYSNNKLNTEIVGKITANLRSREIKAYVKALKRHERSLSIYVESALELNNEYKQQIRQLFSDKNVLFIINEDLIFGIRITENDNEYNFDLRSSVSKITEYLYKYL